MIEDRYSMSDSNGNVVHFTDSQKKCIDYDGRSALVIKGTAGSGKSMMIIKRAIEYRKQIIDSGIKQKVGIFVYNVTLAQGLYEILEKNGISKSDQILEVTTVDSYLTRLCIRYGMFHTNNDFREKNDRVSHPYGNQYNLDFVNNNVRNDTLNKILEDVSKINDHPYYHRDVQFWADEILWMYRNGIVDDDDKYKYMSMSRDGRCKKYNIHLNKEGRKIVFDVFVKYNRHIFKKGLIESDRAYALLYRELGDKMDPSFKYDYLLIDEAQDLSLIKMKILKNLCKSELNVALDKNQSLYGHRWNFKRDLELTPHVKKLTVMHRGTKEIDDFSSDLKKIEDSLIEYEDIYENEISTRHSGILPNIVKCKSPSSEIEFIINEIKGLYNGKINIGILCPDYHHLKIINEKLKKEGIETEFIGDFKKTKYNPNPKVYSALSPGIKLCTIHSAKGLGFVYVFIPNFEEGVYPKSVEHIITSIEKNLIPGVEEQIDYDDAISEEISESRRLAYVGITRAMANVYLTYSGKESRFVYEFEKQHYRHINESHAEIEKEFESTPNRTIRGEMIGDTLKQTSKITVDTTSKLYDSYVAPSSNDDLIQYLIDNDIEFIDRRPKGALWILDGEDISHHIETLRKMGYSMGYTSNGSRSTDYKPSYYYG